MSQWLSHQIDWHHIKHDPQKRLALIVLVIGAIVPIVSICLALAPYAVRHVSGWF
jgi:hypothetical protein